MFEGLRRWWAELRDPASKCKRIGHSIRSQQRTGFENGSRFFRCVADSVEQRRSICTRCDHTDEWEEVDRDGINSLSLPQSDMRTMERDGVVWMKNWMK